MRRGLVAGSFSLLAAAVIVAVPAALSSAQTAGGGTRAIPAGGTTSIRGSAQGPDGLQQPELRPGGERGRRAGQRSTGPVRGSRTASSRRSRSTRQVARRARSPARTRTSSASVNGLTHRDQRLANGGNQFSLEPPDQALCVGNGFMVEAVNSVLRVRSAATGAALTGVAGPEHLLRLPGGDQPHDRRDRPAR